MSSTLSNLYTMGDVEDETLCQNSNKRPPSKIDC